MAKRRRNNEGSYGEKLIKGVKYKFYKFPDGHYVYAKTAKGIEEKKNQYLKQQKEENDFLNITDPRYIFSDMCKYWLKNEAYGELSYRSYDEYESILKNRIVEYKKYDIGTVQLKSLTVDMFNNYLKSFASDYSRASIVKTWAFCRQVLKYCFKYGYVNKFDFDDIKIPKEKDVKNKKKEIPILTINDMEKIYNESKTCFSNGNYRYGNNALAIIFIMYSGCRISEVIGLKWKYVSEDFESVKISQAATKSIKRDKNGNPIKRDDGTFVYEQYQKDPKSESGNRTIPLPDRAIESLKYMYDNYSHNAEDFVFVSSNGSKLIARNVARTLKAILNNCGITNNNHSLHSLRHGYGSLLISKGVDIKLVSELLGHSKVSTTYDIYIGILKEDKIAAVKSVFNKKED